MSIIFQCFYEPAVNDKNIILETKGPQFVKIVSLGGHQSDTNIYNWVKIILQNVKQISLQRVYHFIITEFIVNKT